LLSIIEDSIKIDDLIKKINVLDALYWIKDSWNLVSEETIRNCYRKAGFLQENQDSSITSSGSKDIFNDESELVCMLDMMGVPEINKEGIINFDSSLPIADNVDDKNLDNIVFEDFLNGNSTEEVDDECNAKSSINDGDTCEKHVTYSDVKEYLKVIKSFVTSKEPDLLQKLHELQ
jgi:hypothetical protein